MSLCLVSSHLVLSPKSVSPLTGLTPSLILVSILGTYPSPGSMYQNTCQYLPPLQERKYIFTIRQNGRIRERRSTSARVPPVPHSLNDISENCNLLCILYSIIFVLLWSHGAHPKQIGAKESFGALTIQKKKSCCRCTRKRMRLASLTKPSHTLAAACP